MTVAVAVFAHNVWALPNRTAFELDTTKIKSARSNTTAVHVEEKWAALCKQTNVCHRCFEHGLIHTSAPSPEGYYPGASLVNARSCRLAACSWAYYGVKLEQPAASISRSSEEGSALAMAAATVGSISREASPSKLLLTEVHQSPSAIPERLFHLFGFEFSSLLAPSSSRLLHILRAKHTI
ncbi:uncharacterized protein UV8b_04599 [Ustilaginoidea virens]|uniref:Uncharacterized protein n=1 Tax=Ustilaginoidea virens TaxID=1159556 RepID=A0A8E5MHB9_USTVR|nr:uncharacterized protein UV8b_04599 [Ustilaginoidea virens]QUC20358.1 hypothetical protein UV8b_04599 [Ustilaginoidea virens]